MPAMPLIAKGDWKLQTLECNSFKAWFFISYFLNPHPRICLLILEREEKREREKHQCERETSIGCLSYTPRQGIEPATFWCMGWCSNQLSHPARANAWFWGLRHLFAKPQLPFPADFFGFLAICALLITMQVLSFKVMGVVVVRREFNHESDLFI